MAEQLVQLASLYSKIEYRLQVIYKLLPDRHCQVDEELAAKDIKQKLREIQSDITQFFTSETD